MIMLGGGDDKCVTLWLVTYQGMQGEQGENSYDGYGNVSSSEEIGKIRRYLC